MQKLTMNAKKEMLLKDHSSEGWTDRMQRLIKSRSMRQKMKVKKLKQGGKNIHWIKVTATEKYGLKDLRNHLRPSQTFVSFKLKFSLCLYVNMIIFRIQMHENVSRLEQFMTCDNIALLKKYIKN